LGASPDNLRNASVLSGSYLGRCRWALQVMPLTLTPQ